VVFNFHPIFYNAILAEDDVPVIIYPSGTVPSNFEGNRYGSNEEGQVEDHQQQQHSQYQNEDLGGPPHLRGPRPPHLNRYQAPPVRGQPQQRRPLPPPPPPNWRRPPPPQPGPEAFQRNVPEEEGLPIDAAAPRQNPYDGPPPPPPPPPRLEIAYHAKGPMSFSECSFPERIFPNAFFPKNWELS